jgi:RsiW-degrading membrane proteinase PrsW (M82 family)
VKQVSAESTTNANSKDEAAKLARVRQHARTLRLESAFPFKVLMSPKVLRNPNTWLILLFGLSPLVEFSLSPGVQELVLFLVVYFATAWCAYLDVFVFKRDVSLKFGLAAMAFSFFIGYPLDLLLAHVAPLSPFYHLLSASVGIERFIGYVIGVGLEEELLKGTPVMLLAFVFGRVKKPTDAIFFSALSGFGFAINESSRFIVGMHNPAGILGQTLLRTTALPFLHAAWTSVSGYFIGLAAVKRRGRATLAIVGIALAAVVHGCFDAAPDGLPTICAGLLAFLLFVSYIASPQEMDSNVALGEPAKQVDSIAVVPCAQETAAGAGGNLS